MDRQISLIPRQPESVTWNPWHGCTKVSPGCLHCYMYRRDESTGRDPSVVERTRSFDLPLRTEKGEDTYVIPPGSQIFTCFSSDFFHPSADVWRDEAWEMMRARIDCSFFMITKRPERIKDHLPSGWGDGWEHVEIAVTCENQDMADRRLPVYLTLPLKRRSVMIEPMLSPVDLGRYIGRGPYTIDSVSVGGESWPDARACDFTWVIGVRDQCAENGVSFSYHQTGAKLIKDGRLYSIPREKQHDQARRAGLDFEGK